MREGLCDTKSSTGLRVRVSRCRPCSGPSAGRGDGFELTPFAGSHWRACAPDVSLTVFSGPRHCARLPRQRQLARWCHKRQRDAVLHQAGLEQTSITQRGVAMAVGFMLTPIRVRDGRAGYGVGSWSADGLLMLLDFGLGSSVTRSSRVRAPGDRDELKRVVPAVRAMTSVAAWRCWAASCWPRGRHILQATAERDRPADGCCSPGGRWPVVPVGRLGGVARHKRDDMLNAAVIGTTMVTRWLAFAIRLGWAWSVCRCWFAESLITASAADPHSRRPCACLSCGHPAAHAAPHVGSGLGFVSRCRSVVYAPADHIAPILVRRVRTPSLLPAPDSVRRRCVSGPTVRCRHMPG